MIRLFLALFCLFFLIGCASNSHEAADFIAESFPQSDTLVKVENKSLPLILKKLPGEWGTTHNNEGFFESWENVGDSVLKGVGYQIEKQAVSFEEKLQMKLENGKLFYVATVENQNEGESVSFPLTEVSDNHFLFHNPAHDFPQKITYDFVTDSLLIITVGGLRDSIWDQWTLSMMRQH